MTANTRPNSFYSYSCICEKKFLLVCCLLISTFTSSTHAAVSFAFILKERVYWQTGNQRASNVFELNVAAGIAGDSQVTGGSVSYPGDSVDLSGEDGSYSFEPGDYFSLEELNAVFPNGDVSLSITENGDTQTYGPFSLTGDAYPEVPFVTNSEALQSADFSQDFSVTWDAFDDAEELDEVLFMIEDNLEDGNPVFELLPGSTTSFLIPGGTLSNDGDYSIQVSFIKKTATPPPSVDLKVGYSSQTRVSTVSTSEDPYANWERSYNFHGEDSSEGGDPDRDGLINLLEMIFGTNPTLPGDLPSVNPVIVTENGTDYPGVEILQISNLEGVESHVEAASDPHFFNLLTQVQVGAPEALGDGREKRVFRSETPLSGTTRVLFRLSVDAFSFE